MLLKRQIEASQTEKGAQSELEGSAFVCRCVCVSVVYMCATFLSVFPHFFT